MNIKQKATSALIALLLTVTPSLASLEDRLLSNSYNVRRVVDGDTVLLENRKYVRLAGIDTPELKGKRYDHNQKGAVEATDRLRYLIKSGDNKIILERYENEPEHDKYHRLVGDVYINKENEKVYLNLKMIEEGYARAKHFGDFRHYTSFLKKAEMKAKEKGKGIWEDKENDVR